MMITGMSLSGIYHGDTETQRREEFWTGLTGSIEWEMPEVWVAQQALGSGTALVHRMSDSDPTDLVHSL
jgi:hypothetical protein